MKKKPIFLFGVIFLSSLGLQAQSTLDSVLTRVERNSRTLEANSRLTDARKLEARTGRFLADPNVGFEHMWSKAEGKPTDYSVSLSQSLDFPTAYIYRTKLSRLRQQNLDMEFSGFRQRLLLETKQTCIGLVYLNKKKDILDERLANARHLTEVYAKRMDQGAANRIEANKVMLEQLNMENQVRLNAVEIETALKRLQHLNGGQALAFVDKVYASTEELDFDRLKAEFLDQDPETGVLRGEQQIARKEVSLSRSVTLPKLDLGYKHADSSVGEPANGLTVGISIPLFEKKNTVKRSKAAAGYADVAFEDHRMKQEVELRRLYDEVESYRLLLREYASVLEQKDNLRILEKARESGQISVMDYCSEVAAVYDSWLQYIEMERNFNLLLAELYRYRL